MRRSAWVVVAAVLAALAGGPVAAPALAQPTGAPEGEGEGESEQTPEPAPGEEMCTVTDPRLTELSGLEAIEDGYVVVNDSQELDDRLPIFFLDRSCEVVDRQGFQPGRPLDPEDLALDRENELLWVGDTGDNLAGAGQGESSRFGTVALWRVDLSGGDRTPVIHRFVYPDGEPRDAEALILDGDGTPLIVTKEVTGPSEIYRPTELVPDNPPERAVPLEKLGEFTPPDTDTGHEVFPPAAARRAVTGGANSPDGTRVVLRTYTDAFEFDVVDGDVVGAITEGDPRITPLPPEPQGEAIAYTVEGDRFLTVSDAPPVEVELDEPFAPVILAATPTPPAPPSSSAEPAEGDSAGSGGSSLFSLDPDKIMLMIGAVGVLGLVMVAVGVVGIVRARRRSAADGEGDDDGEPAPTRGVAAVGAAAAPVAAAASVAAGGGAGTVYGGAARVPAPSPPGDDAVPPGGWEPEVAERPGVYRSGGGAYQGGEYGGDAHGGGYEGGTYRAGGYQDHGAAGYVGTDDGAGYGGEYEAGAYHEYDAGAYPGDEAVDDYYDDPDYSYEFRRPGQDRY